MVENHPSAPTKKAKLAAALKRNMARRKAVAKGAAEVIGEQHPCAARPNRVGFHPEPRSEGVWGDRPHRSDATTEKGHP